MSESAAEILARVTLELTAAAQACCAGGEGAAGAREEGYARAASGLLSLKALNRQLSTSVDAKRRAIEERKERVDNLHLQLENLLYKKAYLLREIRECRDFTTPALKTVESEVNVRIAATEFSQQLPKQHDKAVTFLENELQQREEARRLLEERRKSYLAAEEQLDSRRKIIDELPGRIQRVEAAVQEELNPIFQRSHTMEMA